MLASSEGTSSASDNGNGKDILFQPHTLASTSNTSTQILLKLPHVALACDRFGYSDRGAATLANALMFDLGFISETNTTNVINRMKIRRERRAQRLNMKEQSKVDELVSLYFDGEKYKTLQNVKSGDKYFRIFKSEEYSII